MTADELEALSQRRMTAELDRLALLGLMLPKEQKPHAFHMARTLRAALAKPVEPWPVEIAARWAAEDPR